MADWWTDLALRGVDPAGIDGEMSGALAGAVRRAAKEDRRAYREWCEAEQRNERST